LCDVFLANNKLMDLDFWSNSIILCLSIGKLSPFIFSVMIERYFSFLWFYCYFSRLILGFLILLIFLFNNTMIERRQCGVFFPLSYMHYLYFIWTFGSTFHSLACYMHMFGSILGSRPSSRGLNYINQTNRLPSGFELCLTNWTSLLGGRLEYLLALPHSMYGLRPQASKFTDLSLSLPAPHL
jgi:hypothetical protein